VSDRCDICERTLPVLPGYTHILVAHVCGGVPRHISIAGRPCDGAVTESEQLRLLDDDAMWALGPSLASVPLLIAECELCAAGDRPCYFCRDGGRGTP
jgi:hypothetical protein